MSSGPTTWPIDGPPIAPSITFVSLPTTTIPAAQVPVLPPTSVVLTLPTTQTDQATVEAQLRAIASRVVPSP